MALANAFEAGEIEAQWAKGLHGFSRTFSLKAEIGIVAEPKRWLPEGIELTWIP